MLISLSLENFKGVRRDRVLFGPLTALVGHNGRGKSTVLDAMELLARLTRSPIDEAVARVGRVPGSSPLNLVYGRESANPITLSADMIVPPVLGEPDQVPGAGGTFLTYRLTMRFLPETGRMRVEHEDLDALAAGTYGAVVPFPSSVPFDESVYPRLWGDPGPYVTTAVGSTLLHGNSGQHARSIMTGKSPFTAIGSPYVGYPAVLAAKREMGSWRFLRAALDSMPGSFGGGVPHQQTEIASPHTQIETILRSTLARDPDLRAEVVFWMRRLIPMVEDIRTAGDPPRIEVRVADVGGWIDIRSLSGSALRYLLLALMPHVSDVSAMCVESPESGLHHSRIPGLVDMLRDFAVDPSENIASDNPLRQVIVKTHSREVVRHLRPEEIVFVGHATRSKRSGGLRTSAFRHVEGTWRARVPTSARMPSLPTGMRAVTDFVGERSND